MTRNGVEGIGLGVGEPDTAPLPPTKIARNADNAPNGLIISVEEAATLLFPNLLPKTATTRLYSWLRQGTLPPNVYVKAGRRIYIRRAALERWAAGMAEEPTHPHNLCGVGPQSLGLMQVLRDWLTEG